MGSLKLGSHSQLDDGEAGKLAELWAELLSQRC